MKYCHVGLNIHIYDLMKTPRFPLLLQWKLGDPWGKQSGMSFLGMEKWAGGENEMEGGILKSEKQAWCWKGNDLGR